ncbi:MAG: T9SS type A sorting domain-containing protein [Chitinophagales bacterium]
MKKALLLVFASIVFMQYQQAQTPTWSDDIARIMYKNCTSCHHTGGMAPFSLTNYADAYSHRYDISTYVNNGKMPPWPPDANYNHLKDERKLSADDLAKINDWITNSAPEGNSANTPTPPVYTNTSELGTVDMSLTMPTFTVPNYPGDLYQCFVLPTNLAQDEFITGLEILPGNPEIVHHVLIYEDSSSTHEARLLDANTPEPGYTSFGGIGLGNNTTLVGGWVPGGRPAIYPANMGIKIHTNCDLVIQVHYPFGSAGKMDSTKLNLRLSTSVGRQISINPILNHIPVGSGFGASLVNGPLYIPANTVKKFESAFTIPTSYPIQGVSLLNLAPHAHLLCKDWLVYAITPTGDTVPLIKIDDWDFHWQGFYTLQKLKFIPKGSTVYGFATYDNTSNNPNNPNNPPQNVSVGEATSDEMMLVYFSYLIYQNGDENVVLDSTLLDTVEQPNGITIPQNNIVSSVQLYEARPNPANNETVFSYFLPETGNISFKLYDLNGRLVQEISVPKNTGFNTVTFNTEKLQAGTYLYSLNAGGITRTKQLVISH